MYCVLSGMLAVKLERKTVCFDSNSVLIFPPQTSLEITEKNNQATEVLEILFELSDEAYMHSLINAGIALPVDDFILNCVQQVISFINSRKPDLRRHAYSFLDAALSQICILAKVFTPYTINSQLVDIEGFSNATKSVIIYIDAHFTEQFTLDKMSKDLDFTQSYLCAAFKRDTGSTINDYLNLLRINSFIKLFFDESSNNINIGDICKFCGFSNASHLNRTFKKFLGTSPSRYKRLRLSQYDNNVLAQDIKKAGTMYNNLSNILLRMRKPILQQEE